MRVWIVGAGPGDPGLITARGLELLRRADVVIHDRLVAPELLHEARPGALLIDAGKEPGGRRTAQGEIVRLMVRHARAGREVVRLKGGDPFVFGRGGEEAEAMARAGVAAEVVPGVTSAVAVPAAAGIPVTHREHASSLAVVTAHRAGDGEPPWQSLAGIETVVVLMGARHVGEICRRLVAAGKAPDTPAAAVRWGTTDRQRSVVATLADLPAAFAAAGLGSPAVIVVGDVVRVAERVGPAAAPAAEEALEAIG